MACNPLRCDKKEIILQELILTYVQLENSYTSRVSKSLKVSIFGVISFIISRKIQCVK